MQELLFMAEKMYAQDGVDVEKEATFSRYAGTVCKASYKNSPFVDVHEFSGEGFRGPRPVSFKNLPEGFFIEATTDSIGTKGVINDAAGQPETSACDLVAMTASDITRFGGVPLVMINILDVVQVGEDGSEHNTFYKKLLTGLGQATREINVVVLKGETAQMGVCVGSDIPDSPTRYNWGATMLGAYHTDKMVTGNTVTSGQKVIALKERGFRCNGFSSVRKALAQHYGKEWWKSSDAKHDIKAAAAPSVLYDSFINTLHGWYAKDWQPEVKLHAIVHLSGGGIKEKFANDLVFPRDLSARFDDLYDPPDIMRKCAQWRGVKDEEFYEMWNGGQGMLLVVDAGDAKQCVSRAGDFGLEAKVCGEITKDEKPRVILSSELSDKTVVYER